MSDRQRAFQALRGEHRVPRVGDRAIFNPGFGLIDAEFGDDDIRTVEVLRVSASGKTIWTRFVRPEGRKEHGRGVEPQRWKRGEAAYYWSYTPFGELRFR